MVEGLDWLLAIVRLFVRWRRVGALLVSLVYSASVLNTARRLELLFDGEA